MTDPAGKVVMAAMRSDEAFRHTLESVIKEELGLSVLSFCRAADLSSSTLYKLLTGERKPNLKTLRAIVGAIRRLTEKKEEGFIAVIAARPVLDGIAESSVDVGGSRVRIREYAATSIEEAILAALRAEREGAIGLACAPIVSTTVEKILSIPVATITPKESLWNAVKLAAKKSI
ncbi:MAG: helix-turn-helix domain-containing protein [Methermicoccaceae archaeon]